MSQDHEFDYEEISSDEVDRVVAALETLRDSVESDTIKAFIDECSTSVYYLVYEDEESAEAA